jgi:hypothetical protein
MVAATLAAGRVEADPVHGSPARAGPQTAARVRKKGGASPFAVLPGIRKLRRGIPSVVS